VVNGDPANAVVLDFKPGIDAGPENLPPRAEDARLMEQRPASDRRRAIQEGMADRAEGEERADVARRLDRREEYPTGPSSYEIGSADDPDWAADDDGES
jgi:GTP-binding protein